MINAISTNSFLSAYHVSIGSQQVQCYPQFCCAVCKAGAPDKFACMSVASQFTKIMHRRLP